MAIRNRNYFCSRRGYGRKYFGWKTVRAFFDPRFDEEGLLYRAARFMTYKTKHPNTFRWGLVANG